ncbi:MAG: CoA ester lyase [Proteobacteria bacterium]|nr:CoA ester lyase [Pseudomonadota bacterium]
MPPALHPTAVLFQGEALFPALPACDHYAGTEKLMRRSLLLQRELGPVFDITCDCDADNAYGRVGARIHDVGHPHWRDDLEIIVGAAGDRLAFLTLPTATGAADVATMTNALHDIAARHGIARPIPVHVLIETHGALREAYRIASLPEVECIDFGLMDFISAHHGAIPASAMKSPGQFEHPLVVRAKCEIAAAALAAGRRARGCAPCPQRIRVPAHVEHPSRSDPSHRRSHAAGLQRGAGGGGNPDRGTVRPLGADTPSGPAA